MYALVDCNNFYASCETLFRPDLRGKPIVVLSNNDGCVIARSAEAKQLGIPMGIAAFKIRRAIRQHGISVFSSNYALYGDMSARVMETLEQLAPAVEVYSIDEAFLALTGIPSPQLAPLGQHIQHTIKRHQGLPVCVGIAPTKTLAKLANHAAKRWPATRGIVALQQRSRQRKLMGLLAVSDVWGVGRRLAERLEQQGIRTALALADCDHTLIHRRFGVVLARIVRELNGEPCIPLEQAPPARQQIICSRSFGERVTDKTVMQHALTTHAWRAAERLRQQHGLARQLGIFIRTSPFTPDEAQYSNQASGEFATATADARELLAMTRRLLDLIWRQDYHYAKAGVILTDICHRQHHQAGLFDTAQRPHQDKLMHTLDHINQQGIGKVWLAAQGMDAHRPEWGMKRNRKSPAYTTRWTELFAVQ